MRADHQRKPKNPNSCLMKVTMGGSSWAAGVVGFAATAVVVVAVAEVLVPSASFSVVDGLLEFVEDVGSADSVVRVLVPEDVVVFGVDVAVLDVDVAVLEVDSDSDLLSLLAPKPNSRRRKVTNGFSLGVPDARVAGAATLAVAEVLGDSVVVRAVLLDSEVELVASVLVSLGSAVSLLDDEADVDELSELSLPEDVVRVLVLSSSS